MANKALTVDVSKLLELSQNLGKATPTAMGDDFVSAINEVTERTYKLSRETILQGINLTEQYITRKMVVTEATNATLRAEILAPAGKGYITSLSHYGALQQTADVNWSNERIQSEGYIFGSKGPGGFPWTRRTGHEAIGIPEGQKAAGRSVEVVKGSRKQMGSMFALPGKKDNDGNLIVFRRIPGTKKKAEALTGPSVYQLFRIASDRIINDVEDDLQQTLLRYTEASIERAFA